jgi:hypothetical protein
VDIERFRMLNKNRKRNPAIKKKGPEHFHPKSFCKLCGQFCIDPQPYLWGKPKSGKEKTK